MALEIGLPDFTLCEVTRHLYNGFVLAELNPKLRKSEILDILFSVKRLVFLRDSLASDVLGVVYSLRTAAAAFCTTLLYLGKMLVVVGG